METGSRDKYELVRADDVLVLPPQEEPTDSGQSVILEGTAADLLQTEQQSDLPKQQRRQRTASWAGNVLIAGVCGSMIFVGLQPVVASWKASQAAEHAREYAESISPSPKISISPSPSDLPSMTPTPTPEKTPEMLIHAITPSFIKAYHGDELIAAGYVEPKGTIEAPNAHLGGQIMKQFGVPEGDYVTPDGNVVPEPGYSTWWSDGWEPGSEGMAVFLGHKWEGGEAIFNKMPEVQEGDTFVVIGTDSSGKATTLTFKAIKIESKIPKDNPDALKYTIENNPPGSRLAVVTCTGTLDNNGHIENTVFFYSLVSAE